MQLNLVEILHVDTSALRAAANHQTPFYEIKEQSVLVGVSGAAV